MGVCLRTNLVYGLSLIFVLSSPLDLLKEWRGVRKKLPQVVTKESAPKRRLLQAASLCP